MAAHAPAPVIFWTLQARDEVLTSSVQFASEQRIWYPDRATAATLAVILAATEGQSACARQLQPLSTALQGSLPTTSSLLVLGSVLLLILAETAVLPWRRLQRSAPSSNKPAHVLLSEAAAPTPAPTAPSPRGVQHTYRRQRRCSCRQGRWYSTRWTPVRVAVLMSVVYCRFAPVKLTLVRLEFRKLEGSVCDDRLAPVKSEPEKSAHKLGGNCSGRKWNVATAWLKFAPVKLIQRPPVHPKVEMRRAAE